MFDAVLVGARPLSSNVRELTFEAKTEFSYRPGQWVNVHIPADRNERGEPLKRAYSIASSPSNNGRFDLAVAHSRGGLVSSVLHAAAVGDRFQVSGPFGEFLMAPIERPFLMVATGAGIAPFRSMLQASAIQAKEPMALLLGSRDESELLYQSEFWALERDNPLFHFYPTLSQPGSNWRGRVGYVQAHLLDVADFIRGSSYDVYICGQPSMVKDVRVLLHERRGIDPTHIHVERY